MRKMTTMQIGKDNWLQMPYVEDAFACVRGIGGRDTFHPWFLGSARLARFGGGRTPLRR